MARDPYRSIAPCQLSGSGEQVPSAVGPDLLHPVLLRARVKVALTPSSSAYSKLIGSSALPDPSADPATPCQGHSHPKLLVALGVGSKSSADNIQPTAHKPTGYGQYVRMSSSPANSCLLFLSPTQVVPTLLSSYDPCPGLPPSHHHHDSTPIFPSSSLPSGRYPLGGPLKTPSGRSSLGGGRSSSIRSGLLLLALRLWPWRRSQKNKTSFEDIGVLSFAGLAVTGTVAYCL